MKEAALQMAGLLVALGVLARLGFLYWRLPAIWRGSTALPTIHSRMMDVFPRSYLSFLICATGTLLAWAGFGIFFALRAATFVPALISLVLAAVGLAGLILHWIVNSTNRPSFLVPPPFRAEQGRFAERRARRQRRKAGLPPTEHVVEILQVLDGGEPYFFASCTDCDWAEFGESRDLHEEQALRDKTALHTSRDPGAVRPLVA